MAWFHNNTLVQLTLREAMEKQWREGRIQSGIRKAKWKPLDVYRK